MSTCKRCGAEVEYAGKATGWVDVVSGDDGGTYDVCPENTGDHADPFGNGHMAVAA
jgi:hypothetical protein